ncbi:MAG: EF-P lysine aminoacylase EpmA [Gammaproteobacteria bacterium]|nr:EF-P lysine aminoacylase EpmA [Gammaproteobacteria bacterium]
MTGWRPAATPELLRLRAETLAAIRRFFTGRGVLEVETPLLAPATVTDVHIDSIPAQVELAGRAQSRYLQTSPEYAMKRLLAAGAGACYQICKSFRQGDAGKLHNPEFTLLEWYRPGFGLEQLMDEVESLLRGVMPDLMASQRIPRLSYREVFQRHLEIDPHRIEPEALRRLTRERLPVDTAELDATDCLQLLLGQVIEPELPKYCFVYEYPAAQSALAKITPDREGEPVARRFELFCNGMELANGYDEETDGKILRERFERDRERRAELGRPVPAIDEKLLAALDHGLPPCSGVALGVDRLLMLRSGAKSINEVLAFPVDCD